MSNNAVEVVVRPPLGHLIGIEVSVHRGVVHLSVRGVRQQDGVNCLEVPFLMTIGEAQLDRVIKIDPISREDQAKMIRELLEELAKGPNEKPLPPGCER